ncbi:MAG: DUF4445 domain-containing protein [Acidimicrobiales bacterium]|nr:DUF4445 domain-containing protein [Acidimicrobiales bacterium]
MTEKHHVVFTPSGLRGEVDAGTSILDAARALGADIDSVCGGRGICGRCQVVPSFGEFAKHGITSEPSAVSARGQTETDYRGRRPLGGADHRLSCSAEICGDLVVDVPAASQVHRQVIRKRVEVPAMAIDPVLHLYYVEVPAPELDEPRGELARVRDQLRADWSLDIGPAGLTAIDQVQRSLVAQRDITVAVRDDNELVGAVPGFADQAVGVAVDVGSTTIAGHLCDLATGEILATAGRMNPQIRFGEDLMSRVSYVMMNPDGSADLTTSVRAALDELVGELCADADVDRSAVYELTLVGNPVMHHLLLGLDSVPLGGAPFALATDEAVEIAAQRLGIEAHPNARAYVLPCIAGHVGADTAAAILSEAPHRSTTVQLLVDVGTNAEIVVGNSERLLAASSPTGPAFEGAQISCGQRATAGAIERVRVDRETLEPRIRIIGSELWSTDDGFAADTEQLEITGVCGSGIIEVVAELHLSGVISTDGVIDGTLAARTDRIEADDRTFKYRLHGDLGAADALYITQNDVRAIQLAKAALYAGIQLLLDHYGTPEKPAVAESIRLAGAFGSHIDPVYAVALGLVPDCPIENVSAAGNAAGVGAVMALLSANARREIEGVVRHVTKIETATEAKFQDHFVEAMAIPHNTAEYPHLSQVLDLPPRRVTGGNAADGNGGSRRRRRRAR